MRISSSQSWNSSLSHLIEAQGRQMDANERYSTQRQATDLMGFGRSAEVIHTYQSTLASAESHINVNIFVTARLESQDLALTTISEAAEEARALLMNAVAANEGTTVLEAMETILDKALTGLNLEHNGGFLFSGGQEDTLPVTISDLTGLVALPSASDAFENGEIIKTSRLDEKTIMETGFLADELGTDLLSALRDFKIYYDANGPYRSPMSEAQRAQFVNFATRFSDAHRDLIDQTAINGNRQAQVDTIKVMMEKQVIMLKGFVSEKVDADMGEAFTRMQQAQSAVQASAQVISTLKSTNLLNYLR